ncbi:hypothetical protein YC2023_113689 [Brassica napus]
MHKTIVFITSLQPSNHQNFIPNSNRHIEVHTIKKFQKHALSRLTIKIFSETKRKSLREKIKSQKETKGHLKVRVFDVSR